VGCRWYTLSSNGFAGDGLGHRCVN
jgi:hypothetical protein